MVLAHVFNSEGCFRLDEIGCADIGREVDGDTACSVHMSYFEDDDPI